MAKKSNIPPELKGKVEELKRALFMRESNRTAEIYKELLSAKPDLVLREPVQYDLARMLEKGGHQHLALEAYRLLLEHHPKHKSRMPALKAAGILAYKVEQFTDCATYLQDFLKCSPPLSVDREEAHKYLEKLPAGIVSKAGGNDSGSSVSLADNEKKEPSGIADKISLDWKVPSTAPKVGDKVSQEMNDHSSIKLSVPDLAPPELKKKQKKEEPSLADDEPIRLDPPQTPLGAGSLEQPQDIAPSPSWPQQHVPPSSPPPVAAPSQHPPVAPVAQQPPVAPPPSVQPPQQQQAYGWAQQPMAQPPVAAPAPGMQPVPPPQQGEGPDANYPQPMQSPMYPYPPVHPSTLQQNYPPPPAVQNIQQQPGGIEYQYPPIAGQPPAALQQPVQQFASQTEIERPDLVEGQPDPAGIAPPETPPHKIKAPSVYQVHREGEDAEERFYRLSQSTFTLMLPRGKRIHLDSVAELVAAIEGISVPHAKKRILKRKGLIFEELTIDEMMAIYPKVRKCHQALVFVSAPPILRPHEIHEILSATIHEKGLKMSNESTTPKIKWEDIRLINCGIVGGEYQVAVMGGIPMREFRFIEKIFDLEDFLESGESDFSEGITEFLNTLKEHSPNAVESFTVSSFLSGKHKKPQSFSNQEEFRWFTTWVLYSHFAEVVDPEELSEASQITSNW